VQCLHRWDHILLSLSWKDLRRTQQMSSTLVVHHPETIHVI
jgi:hypothetical protein